MAKIVKARGKKRQITAKMQSCGMHAGEGKGRK